MCSGALNSGKAAREIKTDDDRVLSKDERCRRRVNFGSC